MEGYFMETSLNLYDFSVFPSQLGWMAFLVHENRLKRLVFGHSSKQSALAALDGKKEIGAFCGRHRLRETGVEEKNSPLIERLRAYAEGEADDFRDVPIDLHEMTAFQQKVLTQCRQIPFGTTLTYGELAVRAHAAGAARAVGSCMARNPLPLIIPCHRVVASGGRLGNFSAPGGTALKKKLLAMERHSV
jgi:methylated-DNA-[protein]-cysteine S-methyltransferase